MSFAFRSATSLHVRIYERFHSNPHFLQNKAVGQEWDPDETEAQSEQADPPVPESKGAQTRRAILAAAIARFGRDGYRATSVADIARDAGVGGTVAYAYFENKEALFFAAVDEDAAGVIHEGLATVLDVPDVGTLARHVDLHPGGRRWRATRWPGASSPASSPRSRCGCSRCPR